MSGEEYSKVSDGLFAARERAIQRPWKILREGIVSEIHDANHAEYAEYAEYAERKGLLVYTWDENKQRADISRNVELIAKVFDTLSGIDGAKATVWDEGDVTADTIEGLFRRYSDVEANDNSDYFSLADDWINSEGQRVRLVSGFDTEIIVEKLYGVYKAALQPTVKSLVDVVCAIEPTLALAGESEQVPSRSVDKTMLLAEKAAIRGVFIRTHGFDPELTMQEPDFNKRHIAADYRRSIAYLDDDPPTRLRDIQTGQRTLSDEQKQHYMQLAEKYNTFLRSGNAIEKSVYAVAELIEDVCRVLSDGDTLQSAVTGYLNRQLTDGAGSSLLMKILLLTRAPEDQLRIIDSLSFEPVIVDESSIGVTDFDMDGVSRAGTGQNSADMSLSSLAEQLTRHGEMHTRLGFMALSGEYGEFPVVIHDGGDALGGRMLILGDNAATYKGVANPESPPLEVNALGVTKNMIIPGFTSDACLPRRLFVSAGERDLYDISKITVSVERFAELKKAAVAAGLTLFAHMLTEIESNEPVGLGGIVDALQRSTQYQMRLGWNAAAEFIIGDLPSSRFLKDGKLIGNCTVSSAVLGDVLRLCGMKKVERLAGILLDDVEGKLPFHAQVGFTDPRTEMVYIADSTGFLTTRGGFQKRLFSPSATAQNQGRDNTVTNPPELSTDTVPEQVDNDAYAEAMMDARTKLYHLADAHLTRAYPTPESLHQARISALHSLGEQHIVRDFFSILHRADIAELSLPDAKRELSVYLERLTRLKSITESSIGTSSSNQDLALRAKAKKAQKVLFGNIDELTYMIATAKSLYDKLVRI
ncbi:hypothetical protein KA016_02915 [Candidatus Saccharibacteria bacterium]|nr:hypothetical protein [Candidatus Saccharibacteria bacterium]